jgi:methyl-accepting chemotaxis protein
MQPKTSVSRLNSIFVKLTAAAVLLTALVAAVLTVMNWRATTTLTEKLVRERASEETIALATDVSGAIRFGRSDKVYELVRNLMHHSSDATLAGVAVGLDGQVIADPSGATAADPALVALAQTALASGKLAVSADGFTVAAPAQFGESAEMVGAIATLWSPAPLLLDAQRDKSIAMAVAGAVFVLAVIANILVLNRLITSPLRRMKSVIEAFGARDYATEVPMQSRKDELGSIAVSLEALRETLAAAQAAELDNTYKSAAFTGSSAAMLLVDTNMVVTHFNAKMVELFRNHVTALRERVPDFDPEHLIGLNVTRFHTPAQHGKASHGLRDVDTGSFTTVIKLGEARISLSAVAIRDDHGQDVGYVMEWADVTQNWMNAALVHAIEANQIKAEFTLDGHLLTANLPYQTLLGQPLETLKRWTLSDLMLDGATDAASILRAAAKGETYLGLLRLQRGSDDFAVIDGSLSCVTDHEGRPIRLLLLGKDVTRAEVELDASRRQRAEAEAQQSAVVEALRLGLRKLNAGDLTARIDEPFAGNYEELRQDFNNTVHSLAKAMQDILSNAENISNEARDISSTAEGLSRRTESTAATLEQTAAALDLLTTSVKATADGAERADQAVSTARANAESSSKVVVETVAAMDQIASSSERITSIIKVIDDIAFQTNLLALNAGVEAARAGDAGRGFAVVASEVRALAQRSSDAAREINDLIANSANQVRRGVTLVDKTGEALKEIAGSVSEIAGLVSDIAVASRQQSANLVEINSAVTQLDQSTQQNAARLEETTAASEGLTTDAVALVQTVSHFKVGHTSGSDQVVAFRSDRAGPSSGSGARHASPARSQGTAAVAVRTEALGWEEF